MTEVALTEEVSKRDSKAPFVRIKLRTPRSISETALGEHAGDEFSILRHGSCMLNQKDFEGSASAWKLKLMFFEGSHLELKFEKDHLVLIAHDAMDCKIGTSAKQTPMEMGTEYRLTSGVNHFLKIDDLAFWIEPRNFTGQA